jgi:Xaa-Pro dipeptidase
MRRREFFAAGAASFLLASRHRLTSAPPSRGPGHQERQQGSSLGPEVFAARRSRAQDELSRRGLGLLLATPSINYHYLVGSSPGRSERLIALLLPARGEPVIVAPSFEVERVRRTSTIGEVRGWEEHQDPYALLARTVRGWRGLAGPVALEPTTEYQTALRLGEALRPRRLVNGGPLFERLRIIKEPEEVALIRRAVAITEEAIAAAFARLAEGMTDREVASAVSQEMTRRGASGGGLVQFGPTSALPHGGTENRRLVPETPVLLDCGCRVEGYTSDVTRTRWFGERPSDRFRRVFNTVHAAQTAAMQLARPGVECQDLDRAARRVIVEAGFGEFFTHRLGHGMGMEGHEVPYLVEGNTLRLEPGMVVTVEPGIYLPGEWGVRIEDDCVMGENGFEVMSRRPEPMV